MKHLLPALRIKLFFMLLLGLAYPLIMTAVSQGAFAQKANGDAQLIAQKFESPKYFWPRPSGVDYNPLPSGGSNLGPTSGDLKKAYDDRRTKLMTAHPGAGEPPQDLLFASGSGLDPDISPEAALYQAQRVAAARSLDVVTVQNLIQGAVQGRQLGVFGEPRVNVLALNLALDKMR